MKPIKTQGNFVSLHKGMRVAAFALESDKKLFEAAPDLLEALEACRDYMTGKATELDLIETDALALAAIAKVEGRQS